LGLLTMFSCILRERCFRRLASRFSTVLLFLQLVLVFPWQGASVQADEAHKAELRKHQERLQRETGVVGKVKTFIRISEVHLLAAARAVKRTSFVEADQFLTQYMESVEQALKTLKSSGRNAQKNPAGFKEFEISLRKQLRTLDDLKSRYSFEETDTTDRAIRAARSAQECMLAEIFGAENTVRRKKAVNQPGKDSK